MTKGTCVALLTFAGQRECEVCCAGTRLAGPECSPQWPCSMAGGAFPWKDTKASSRGNAGDRAHPYSSEGQSGKLGFIFRSFNMFGEGQGLKKMEMAGCGCKVWGLEALRAVWRLCKEKGLKAYELDNSELQTVTRGAWYGRLWSGCFLGKSGRGFGWRLWESWRGRASCLGEVGLLLRRAFWGTVTASSGGQ